MGLENLHSIFNENLNEGYKNNQPQSISDSFIKNKIGSHIAKPILDSILRNAPSFVSNDLLTSHYRTQIFDPRIPKNEGITITPKVYAGTNFDPSGVLTTYNDANYGSNGGSSNYIPLSSITTQNVTPGATGYVGKTLYQNSKGWEALYNKNHTALTIDNPNPNNPFQPYLYGGNVSRDNLSIRYSDSNKFVNTNSLSRTSTINPGGEPYIVSDIATSANDTSGGRDINKGGRFFPISRALTDAERITKYLASPKGLANVVLKNIYSIVKTPVIKDWGNPSHKLKRKAQRFNNTFNPLHTILSAGSRLLGEGVPNILYTSGGIFGLNTKYPKSVPDVKNVTKIRSTMGQIDPYGTGGGFFGGFGGATKTQGNDTITTRDLEDYDPTEDSFVDGSLGSKFGLPLYFIDMRDRKIIYFRGYIEGTSEVISPNWSQQNYVGRSEPAWVFEGNTTREINFTLKLFAQTKEEMSAIQIKMNRLTSLCYPEYQADTLLGSTANQRMKPPITKFRLGDHFGYKKNELTGFIKSLSYEIPEESPWGYGENARTPRYIIATIGYQVIHDKVPQLGTRFYGNEAVKESSTALPTIRKYNE